MTERDRLLQSIATITADYRAGELAAPSPQQHPQIGYSARHKDPFSWLQEVAINTDEMR